MKNKKNVLQMTQREKDIVDFMFAAAKPVLGCNKQRVCIPPSAIRDDLLEKYSYMKVFHVTASQKNLEALGLIFRISDAGTGEAVCGARPASTFEINSEFYLGSEIEIISKRKTGYPAGSYKKPPVTLDKTKTTLKQARELLSKVNNKIDFLDKHNLALMKKLAKNNEDRAFMHEVKTVVSNLLAVKRKNLKNLGLLDEIEKK
jgi:hypothetical protein